MERTINVGRKEDKAGKKFQSGFPRESSSRRWRLG
jgi:hypothetical protein